MVSREHTKLEDQNHEAHCLLREQDSTVPFWSWNQLLLYTDQGLNFGLPGLFEFEPFSLPSQLSAISSPVELNHFEDISGDFGSWDFDQQSLVHEVVNPNPVMNMHSVNHSRNNENSCSRTCHGYTILLPRQRDSSNSTRNSSTEAVNENGKKKSSALRLEDIQRYFDVPITRAATELNVGLTVLKKRCRELNIRRWPHRKIKSLKSLIHNVKELGLSDEIEMLEEHKRMVEKTPQMELTERTKKLRQACFKANYKKRRSLQLPPLARDY